MTYAVRNIRAGTILKQNGPSCKKKDLHLKPSTSNTFGVTSTLGQSVRLQYKGVIVDASSSPPVSLMSDSCSKT